MKKKTIQNRTKGGTVYDSVLSEDYPLDHVQLKRMRKMERALTYMLENLTAEDCSLEAAAEAAGYGAGYFRRAFPAYFGCPFAKYMNRLRLRAAAREISGRPYPRNLWQTFCYANPQAFSRAFKREIGVSPLEFNEGNYEVPDMPLREEVEGVKIDVEYRSVHALRITGRPLLLPEGKRFSLMETVSFAFGKKPPEASGDDVGIWWHDPQEKLHYVYGPVTEETDLIVIPGTAGRTPKSTQVDLQIQGGNYVVFSYPRPEDESRIPLMSRIMARFAFREWIPANRKATDVMGFTYERFTEDRVCLYLPLRAGMESSGSLKKKDWSVSSWAGYIDSHITEPLSTESLARLAGYYPWDYREVFTLYYGITPAEYVLRRKLYLAVRELGEIPGDGAGRGEEILARYGFTSWDHFREQYDTAFPDEPFRLEPREIELPDLMELYESNRDEVTYSVRKVRPFQAVMEEIRSRADEGGTSDPSALASGWFQEESAALKPLRRFLSGSKSNRKKVFLWGNEPIIEGGEVHYPYYLGAMVRNTADREELRMQIRTHGLHLERIEGGRYAVFMTPAQSDLDSLEDAFRLLTRYAFGGWIAENRSRVDMNRRTFVTWQREKLLFHVPLIG